MYRSASAAVIVAIMVLFCSAPIRSENWPGWRGPRGDGTSLEKDVPTHWDGKSGRNIAWKVPVPGLGHASPIVWQDRIFVVSCLEESEQRVLLCLDRATGKTLWQQTVLRSALEKKHRLNSFASSTPVTDGQRVYVSFLEADFGREKLTGTDWRKATPGNMVVAAYDFAGNRQWIARPGRFSSIHGYCSSPVLFRDKVIVNGDHDGDSYIVALDRQSGKTLWKTDRQNKTRSYCVPIIREIDGRTQMILSGDMCVTSYDPHDGSLHWMIDGPTEQFVASIVYNGRLLMMTAGFPEHHILAIRPDGRGNVTDTHIVWRTTKACAYVPSPIVEGDYFLVVSDSGIGSCIEADSGRRLWMERLGSHFSTSLISANGFVYFLCDDGTMTIIRPGPNLDVVTKSRLGENCYASPAVSNGQVFIRSERNLFCIGKGRREDGAVRSGHR